jgi:hypothetical protein
MSVVLAIVRSIGVLLGPSLNGPGDRRVRALDELERRLEWRQEWDARIARERAEADAPISWLARSRSLATDGLSIEAMEEWAAEVRTKLRAAVLARRMSRKEE